MHTYPGAQSIAAEQFVVLVPPTSLLQTVDPGYTPGLVAGKQPIPGPQELAIHGWQWSVHTFNPGMGLSTPYSV